MWMSITYRGFFGQVDETPDGQLYEGYVLDVPERISFSGYDSTEIIESFEACIDAYIAAHPHEAHRPIVPPTPRPVPAPPPLPAYVRVFAEKFRSYGWELSSIAETLNREFHTAYTADQIREICEAKK